MACDAPGNRLLCCRPCEAFYLLLLLKSMLHRGAFHTL